MQRFLAPLDPEGSARLFLLLIHEVELPVRAVFDAILLLLLWLLDSTNLTLLRATTEQSPQTIACSF